MDSTIGEKLKKTAGEVADMLGEAAHTATERIVEMRETQLLTAQIRSLQREKDRCRQTMADLLVRMFDQNAFVEALLRPEYSRIKAIDAEITRLELERQQVSNMHAEPGPGAEAKNATTPPPRE